jgi:hypothetical protein
MSATLESRPATCASRVAQLRWPSIWVATVVAVVVTAWVLFLANGTPAGAAVDDPGTFLVTVLDAVTFAGLLFVLMRAVNMAHGSLFLLAAYVAIRVREAMVEVVHRLVAEGVAVLVVEQNLRAAWNKDVATTHKDGLNDRNSVFDYERGGPAGMRNPYWLTDDSISSSSWCYTVGIGYYSLGAMLHSLIDRVSKNGNVLLNIAPMADGTIPSGQRTILLGMGDYLKRFGESLYATRAWTAFGEGPDPDGWWLLCHAARGNQPGHPVHPQQSQHRAVCHRHGLARQHTEHHHTRLQPAGATAPTAPSASNRHGTAATTSSGASTASATGRHQIINRGTGTALDSLGNSTAGSGTAMWAPNSSPNNHWTIAPV